MTDAYAVTVRLESYEYRGEFYLVGEGCRTPSEVSRHVAAEHLLRIAAVEAVEQYLFDVLHEGETVGEAAYDAFAAAVECWVHVDTYHRLFSFGSDEYEIEIDGVHTETKLEEIAAELPSE
jgi:hypothetical protein